MYEYTFTSPYIWSQPIQRVHSLITGCLQVAWSQPIQRVYSLITSWSLTSSTPSKITTTVQALPMLSVGSTKGRAFTPPAYPSASVLPTQGLCLSNYPSTAVYPSTTALAVFSSVCGSASSYPLTAAYLPTTAPSTFIEAAPHFRYGILAPRKARDARVPAGTLRLENGSQVRSLCVSSSFKG